MLRNSVEGFPKHIRLSHKIVDDSLKCIGKIVTLF